MVSTDEIKYYLKDFLKTLWYFIKKPLRWFWNLKFKYKFFIILFTLALWDGLRKLVFKFLTWLFLKLLS